MNYTNQLLENFKKRKVHSPFIDNTWGSHFVDMQLISKFNKGICFLLCVINIFSKYPCFLKNFNPIQDDGEGGGAKRSPIPVFPL